MEHTYSQKNQSKCNQTNCQSTNWNCFNNRYQLHKHLQKTSFHIFRTITDSGTPMANIEQYHHPKQWFKWYSSYLDRDLQFQLHFQTEHKQSKVVLQSPKFSAIQYQHNHCSYSFQTSISISSPHTYSSWIQCTTSGPPYTQLRAHPTTSYIYHVAKGYMTIGT